MEVRAKYEEQHTHKKGAKHGKSVLDDEDGNEEIDAELIMQYVTLSSVRGTQLTLFTQRHR